MECLKYFTFTFTILFYFFAFSSARLIFPLKLQEYKVVNLDDSRQNIVLSIEKLEPSDSTIDVQPEPKLTNSITESNNGANQEMPVTNQGGSNQETTVVEAEPEINHTETKSISNTETKSANNETTESNRHMQVKELEGSEQNTQVPTNKLSVETLHLNPINYVRIRPIQRHFPYRVKPFTSVFRIHRCPHHMYYGYQTSEVPEGDDMMGEGETIKSFDPSIVRDSIHATPSKRGKIHHHRNHHDEMMMLRHPFRQYIARQKLKKELEENSQRRKEKDQRKKGGFMKRIRKFLNHF